MGKTSLLLIFLVFSVAQLNVRASDIAEGQTHFNMRALSRNQPYNYLLASTPNAVIEVLLTVQKAEYSLPKINFTVQLEYFSPATEVWIITGKVETFELLTKGDFTDLVAWRGYEMPEIYNQEEEVPIRLHFTTNSITPIGFNFAVVQMNWLGRYQVPIAGVLLILVYVLIVFELIHRTTSALLGAFVALVVLSILRERPSIATVVTWIDEGTIGLLLGMMIIIGVFSTTGFFEWGAIKCFKWSGGKVWRLLSVLACLTAFLSAFLDNVTTIMLVAPVTLRLARVVDLPPVPLILSEVFFSNIGGTATLIGDPPNIIIGSMLSEHIQFVDFIIHLAPGLLIALPPTLLYLRIVFRNKLTDKVVEDISELEDQYKITNKRLFGKVIAVLTCVILLFFMEPVTHVEPAWIAMTGAAILLAIAAPHEIETFLEKVEWSTLLFFSGLFIFIEALKEMGLIRFIGDVCTSIIGAASPNLRLTVAVVLIIWVSAIASAFIDNIPYTATMVPVIIQLSEDPSLGLPLRVLAWSLAYGACLGGNGTLIGASANVVAVGIMDRADYKVSFLEFFKYGAPIMLITVSICTIYSLVVMVSIGFY